MDEWNLKYRPKTLDRVEGNAAAVSVIKGWFAGSIPHFILITGQSGTGKTTLARIIKTQLGCADIDFREINAAMFRGIDTARDLQRNIRIAPAAGPVRVIMFDEVQSTTREAQEALLKVLEETPAHVYFIFCTTDPIKLIPTIRNRAAELRTEKLTDGQANELLARVLKKEGINLDVKVLSALIEGAEGCARQLLVNAQKVAAVPAAEREGVAAASRETAAEGIDLCRALLERKDWREVSKILAGLKGEPETVRRGVLGYCRTVLLKQGGGGKGKRAYVIMDCFWKDLYTTGAAGLCYQAFEAVAAKDE